MEISKKEIARANCSRSMITRFSVAGICSLVLVGFFFLTMRGLQEENYLGRNDDGIMFCKLLMLALFALDVSFIVRARAVASQYIIVYQDAIVGVAQGGKYSSRDVRIPYHQIRHVEYDPLTVKVFSLTDEIIFCVDNNGWIADKIKEQMDAHAKRQKDTAH